MLLMLIMCYMSSETWLKYSENVDVDQKKNVYIIMKRRRTTIDDRLGAEKKCPFRFYELNSATRVFSVMKQFIPQDDGRC